MEEPAATGQPHQVPYDKMFPQGPLVPKASLARISHSADAKVAPERYAELMAESTQRRADYLGKLTETPRWWTVADLVSIFGARLCSHRSFPAARLSEHYQQAKRRNFICIAGAKRSGQVGL